MYRIYLNILLIMIASGTAYSGTHLGSNGSSNKSDLYESALEEQRATKLFDDYIEQLYIDCGLEGKLSFRVFKPAIVGYFNMRREGMIYRPELTICDFRQPSTERRFYVIDLESKDLIYNTLVAHGENTGNKYVVEFSNDVNSHQSSLGFYVTGETYTGKNGLSMRLDGIDISFNDNARIRNVVLHGAHYVNNKLIYKEGLIGTSQGCPAIPMGVHEPVIQFINNGSCLFIYANDKEYLNTSAYLNYEKARKHFMNNIGVFR